MSTETMDPTVVIVINNTKGEPLFGIAADGHLRLAGHGGDFPVRCGFVQVERCGFALLYKRRDLSGGQMWVYERPGDGVRLRRHEDADDRVWWDTGDTVTTVADIESVRQMPAPSR